MRADIFNLTGKKTGTLELPKELFSTKANNQVIAQYLRVFRSRARSAAGKAKSRGKVVGSTAKIWRQKGTGRARHGARSAPIFVGGGVAHGPTGGQNYKLKLSKKLRRLALLGSLSHKAKDTLVLADLKQVKPQTKTLARALKKITGGTDRTLIILDQPTPSLARATSNLKNINLTQAKRLNPYEVLENRHLIVTKDSLNTLKQTFLAAKKSKAKPVKKSTKEK